MRHLANILAISVACTFSVSSYGQTRHDEKPHGPAKQQTARKPIEVAGPSIELKDGGKIIALKDGTMAHYDGSGQRLKMRDGQVMEAKDGSKLMMRNDAIWKQLTERGTLRPVQ